MLEGLFVTVTIIVSPQQYWHRAMTSLDEHEGVSEATGAQRPWV